MLVMAVVRCNQASARLYDHWMLFSSGKPSALALYVLLAPVPQVLAMSEVQQS